MKKIIVTASILAALAVPAFAEEITEINTPDFGKEITETINRNMYVGIRGYKSMNTNYELDFGAGAIAKNKAKPWGVGLNLGAKLGDYFKVEYEVSYTGSEFEIVSVETNTYTMISNMANVYFGKKLSNGIEPFIGVGAGITSLKTKVHIHETTTHYALRFENTATPFSWQILAGANFEINEKYDLNFGLKYKDYGKIEHEILGIKLADTKINAIEIYMGATYKFSL